MEQALMLQLGLLAAVLLLSAFFSSSETAFVSVQRVRLRHLERIGARGVERLRRLVDRPDRTLATILVGNNLVNTAAAALGTVIVVEFLGTGAGVPVATAGVTILLLLVGEITPKTLAVRHSERLAVLYAAPLEVLSILLAPVTTLLTRFSSAAATLVGGGQEHSLLSHEEIRTVITMGEEAGVLRREETEILHNVLRLEDMVVREVMVPRIEVAGVRADQTLGQVAREIAISGYTRLPVYEVDLDHIVGIVHAKDVLVRLAARENRTTAGQIMRPGFFTPEGKTVFSLLKEMREHNTQTAIVVDEYGGTAGLVTLEDLLEEVVGEIVSEYGAERHLVQQHHDREMVVEAAIQIEELNHTFRIDLPSEEVDTLGGFISQQLGRIPQRGDRFHYRDLEFTVLSMRGRRVGLVRITK